MIQLNDMIARRSTGFHITAGRWVAIAIAPWAALCSWIFVVQCTPCGLAYFQTVPDAVAATTWLAMAGVLLVGAFVQPSDPTGKWSPRGQE